MIRFGKEIIKLDNTDSTNSYAALLLKNKAVEGTVVSTAFQTHGQGQSGNQWVSEPGKNLLISLIIYPEFLHPSQLFLLNQFVSLAIIDFFKICLPTFRIQVKWPNDILIDGIKICGILIQNSFESNHIKTSVVGMGININQAEFKDMSFSATSLKILTGREFDLDDCLNILLSCLESRYFQLARRENSSIRADYLENLYRLSVQSDFIDYQNRKFSGKISGVSDDGRLMILSDEVVLFFNFKEVSFASEF